MKKILVHIGYPKTGTTTLQEEIFVKLHNSGKINFLGRTTKSSHNKYGKSKFNGIDWVWHLRQHLFAGKKLKVDNDILKTDVLNVMSDEDLTFHDFFHYAQFGAEINHFSLPQKLKDKIGDNVEVSILITLRNQVDLMYSSYLQKFRFIRTYLGNYNFSEFLYNKPNYLNRSIEQHLALYDFNKISELWETTFNTKPSVILFEDFVRDKDTFFSKLSHVLPADESELKSLIGDKHYRKKDKSKPYNTSYYKKLRGLGKILGIITGEKTFMQILEKRYHMRNNAYLKYERKILLKYISVKVNKPTEEEKDFIKNTFNKPNLKLAKYYDLDLIKLKTYNYIN